MKLLILDTDKFDYKLDHITPVGEEVDQELMQQEYNNVLVIFTAVEAQDSQQIITKAAKDIRKIARKNLSKLVIINPFAHLFSRLSNPELAISILGGLTNKLCECKDFKTIRSVFGRYKQFSLNVKGHGNSQIYREY